MMHVVMFSSGAGSWAAAKRVAEDEGTDDLVLLFADTLIEDEDNYRFLEEASADVGGQLIKLTEGRDPWQVFFDVRFLGNTRIDPCSRVLKRQFLRKWLEDNCDPDETIVYLGIDWSEQHRFERAKGYWEPWKVAAPMCEPPLLDKRQVLEWMQFSGIQPPRLYAHGFQHANCFSGDTRFITAEGTRTLRECAGKTVTVLGANAAWRPAEIKSFGEQPLLELRLKRYSDEKVVYATADHRWIARRSRHDREEVLTQNLTPGQRLVSMHGRLGASVRPSAFGIAHGIVFGDGTRPSSKTQNSPARLVLCGEKDRQLLKWFPSSPTQEVRAGIEVRDLPRAWKDAPDLSESRSYLYGWLAGYFAADGTVASGQARLTSARREHVELVRDVATRIGISTNRIRVDERIGFSTVGTASWANRNDPPLYTVSFVPGTLREDFFLIAEHRRRFKATRRSRPAEWEVVSVRPTGRTEEVFCAVVPDGHLFTLEDNVLTGNCGGFCIKGGQAQFATLLREFPDRYRYHERREAELGEYLGKTVAILRDRTGGTTKPLTLRAFRERLERQPDLFDQEEWGGCGCMEEAA